MLSLQKDASQNIYLKTETFTKIFILKVDSSQIFAKKIIQNRIICKYLCLIDTLFTGFFHFQIEFFTNSITEK